jgi:alpha-L-fucosidase 2
LACLAAVEADEGTRVQAVVGCAPVTDFEYELPGRGGLVSPSLQALHGVGPGVTPAVLRLLRDTAPIQHVHPGLPPFLIIQGDADRTVPLQESRNFVARLRAVGVPAELVVIPGAPHRLLSWQTFAPDWTDRMVGWLRARLNAAASSD